MISENRKLTLVWLCALPVLLLFELVLYQCALLWFGLHTTPNFSCLLFTCDQLPEIVLKKWFKENYYRKLAYVTKGKSICCTVSAFLNYWAYLGAFAIGVDRNGVLVDSFHKPVRQLVFQSSVEFNLGSEIQIFSQRNSSGEEPLILCSTYRLYILNIITPTSVMY